MSRHRKLSTRIRIVTRDGTVLHPVMMRSRRTGSVSFVVARPGANSNRRENAIDVVDEDTLVEYVRGRRFNVRAEALDGTRKGLRSPDGHDVQFIEVDGTRI